MTVMTALLLWYQSPYIDPIKQHDLLGAFNSIFNPSTKPFIVQ